MSRLNKKEFAAKSIEFFLKKPSPENILWLNFAVTYLCNSRCVMCSIWQKYKQKPELMQEELSLEDIETLLESPYLYNLQVVSFTGGEPFLRKDFVDIVGMFIKKYPKAIFGVATNGLNPRLTVKKIKEIQDYFKPKHLSISLSLDGLFGKHDEMRGVPGAYESLNETIELLKSETDVNIGIDFTITPLNYKELLNVYKYTKEKNIKFLTCFAHKSDAYYGNTETRFDWDISVLGEIEASLKEIVKDKIRSESLLDKIIDPNAFFTWNCVNHQAGGKMHQKCYSGTHSMFLDPTGNIYPCIILNQKMGNIKVSEFDSVWTSFDAEKIRDHIRLGKCSCWVACESIPSMLRSIDVVKWNLTYKLFHGL